jgi:hypothetical protein
MWLGRGGVVAYSWRILHAQSRRHAIHYVVVIANETRRYAIAHSIRSLVEKGKGEVITARFIIHPTSRLNKPTNLYLEFPPSCNTSHHTTQWFPTVTSCASPGPSTKTLSTTDHGLHSLWWKQIEPDERLFADVVKGVPPPSYCWLSGLPLTLSACLRCFKNKVGSLMFCRLSSYACSLPVVHQSRFRISIWKACDKLSTSLWVVMSLVAGLIQGSTFASCQIETSHDTLE